MYMRELLLHERDKNAIAALSKLTVGSSRRVPPVGAPSAHLRESDIRKITSLDWIQEITYEKRILVVIIRKQQKQIKKVINKGGKHRPTPGRIIIIQGIDIYELLELKKMIGATHVHVAVRSAEAL